MSIRARVMLGLLCVLGLVIAYYGTGWTEREDWIICQQAYAGAHTAADTARIDGAPAPRERGRGSYTASAMTTCGEYRLTHRRSGPAT